MHDTTVSLQGWMTYQWRWLIIGLVLIALVVLWYGFVFFITRHKEPRTLATLKPKAYTPPDLSALKQKYLALITEVETAHQTNGLSARLVHQKLSYLLRMFVYEIRGHRVDTLTLADLQRTRYKELTGAIETLYLPEFARVQQGDTAAAIALARKVVREWN